MKDTIKYALAIVAAIGAMYLGMSISQGWIDAHQTQRAATATPTTPTALDRPVVVQNLPDENPEATRRIADSTADDAQPKQPRAEITWEDGRHYYGDGTVPATGDAADKTHQSTAF